VSAVDLMHCASTSLSLSARELSFDSFHASRICPSDKSNEYDTDGGIPKYWEKNLCQCYLFSWDRTWIFALRGR
jgi:hypothetical protein